MGILTLQFGQCGNQIGQALFDYLVKDITEAKSVNTEYKDLSQELWFSDYKKTCYTPRSVLVDTENKVVSSVINDNNLFKFNNVIAKSMGGSANNWAFGYTLKADLIVDEVVDSVRKEIEKSNAVTHILSFLSSGGGTGSGTGSRVLEKLRSDYPNKTIINVIVLPYTKGEIVTQSYNTLLTLAKLHDITDGSILFENDSLHKMCNSLLAIKNIDLPDMNNVIAQKLSSVFQPSPINPCHEFVSHLTAHPNYKFVQIKTTPHIPAQHLKYESLPSWKTLCAHMRKAMRNSSGQHHAIRYWRSVGSLLISRGGGEPELNSFQLLRDRALYPEWINSGDALKCCHQGRKLYGMERFLSLASNNNSVVNVFDSVLEQAWTMFKHKAYLHQYLKYDVTETDFEIAFEKLESVLRNYREL